MSPWRQFCPRYRIHVDGDITRGYKLVSGLHVSSVNAALGKFLTLTPSSINWYRWKLGAEQALHVMHWPRIRGLAASVSVWLRATETEISAALWTLVPRELRTYLSCICLKLTTDDRLRSFFFIESFIAPLRGERFCRAYDTAKPGFHYPSWRPVCWRVMETVHPSTRAVNSGRQLG